MRAHAEGTAEAHAAALRVPPLSASACGLERYAMAKPARDGVDRPRNP
jgi:hypothetical protein